MQSGPGKLQSGYSLVQGMSKGRGVPQDSHRGLNSLRKNSLNEGHGFRRAVKSHSYKGFRGCENYPFSELSPVGTAKSDPGDGPGLVAPNRR